MKSLKAILPLVAVLVATPAFAKDPVVQPVQVGSETVRYVQGSATLDLRQARGAVQVRPLAIDHGSLAFAVAVFNGGETPANIDTGNFVALAGKQTLSPFTMQQLAGKAKSRARWKQFGMAMLGGLGAAAAASQRDYYSGTTFTPYGTYHSTFSAPSAAGQIQAAAITAGTAYSIVKLQQQLDGTLNALAENVVQTTTIEPGQTYGGKIVFAKISGQKLPQQIHLTVSWNGEQYPFAFQLAKEGTPAPVFQAITHAEDMRGMTTAPTSFVSQAMPAIRPTVNAARLVSDDLPALVEKTAYLMPKPSTLYDGSTATMFSANGQILSINVIPEKSLASTEIAKSVTASICKQRAIFDLIKKGAVVQASVASGKREKPAALQVDAETCASSQNG